MALIRVEGDNLVVVIEGLDKLWSFKGSLTVPLANVRGATADPGISTDPKGIRAPGSHVPGVITAGTFHQHGEKVFWNVRDASKAVVVELTGEKYARLVLQVDNPRAAVALIENALT
uniref:Bacterial Pleckstrin homology domain-containing protein n=1 Tax=Streptomyces sp. NBC_01401 TaxID=2903854 RepID=A0AAU3H8L8_9ACTN